jgi:hypothetical protein
VFASSVTKTENANFTAGNLVVFDVIAGARSCGVQQKLEGG